MNDSIITPDWIERFSKRNIESGGTMAAWSRFGRFRYPNYRDKWYRSLRFLFPYCQRQKVRRKVEIIRIIPPRGRAFDHENFTFGCKPIFDHLKHNGWIWDDSPIWIDREYHQVKLAECQENDPRAESGTVIRVYRGEG